MTVGTEVEQEHNFALIGNRRSNAAKNAVGEVITLSREAASSERKGGKWHLLGVCSLADTMVGLLSVFFVTLLTWVLLSHYMDEETEAKSWRCSCLCVGQFSVIKYECIASC